jgi:hypothetical protein
VNLWHWLEEFGQNGGVGDGVEVGLVVGLGGLGDLGGNMGVFEEFLEFWGFFVEFYGKSGFDPSGH